jgi:branched-chain amino acid transport system substrate-binding protein
MFRGLQSRTLAVAAGATLMLTLAACGSLASHSTGPIVLGATLPLTGTLAVFGPEIETAYQQAVAAINRTGGVDVGGTKRQLKLVVKDNRSDPSQVTSTARSLINDKNAAALLGAVTPPLTIPLSIVADEEEIPALSSLTPTQAWKAGNAHGWKYAYDVFTDEVRQTAVDFQASDLVPTNKRVALFTDTEEDGKAMGDLWQQQAPKYGYAIAYRAQFPVGTTDFSQFIERAKGAHADVMIAQVIPPDAAALWKQMKALGYHPKTAWAEKGGAEGFPQAIGPLADGASVFGFWTPTNGNVGGQAVYDSLKAKFGDGHGTQVAVASYAMVQIMADAISRARSTDAGAINKALAQTKDLPTVLARITIGSDHRAVIPVSAIQWQGGRQPVVWPPGQATAKFEAPVRGLAG